MAKDVARHKPRKRANRVPTSGRKPDGAEGKRVPNSLVATLRGIRRLWRVRDVDKPRQAEEFAESFEASFKKVIELYPAYRDESTEISQLVQRLEGIGKHPREICYYHLRAYAEYLDLPTSLLLTFSHVLGDATNGRPKEEILELLQQSTAALQALHRHILDSDSLPKALYEPRKGDDEKPRYNAKLDGLEKMYLAFWPDRTLDLLLD